jgi:hypothetical protein
MSDTGGCVTAGVVQRTYRLLFDGAKRRFPAPLVMRTMHGMILDAIGGQDIARLLLVFEIYQQDDSQSHAVLAKLVHTRQRAMMSSNLIETVVSSERFADLIADFLYMIANPPRELALKCFETVWRSGFVCDFSKFCKSCIANFGDEIFDTFVVRLLQADDEARALHFAEDLLLNATKKVSSAIPALTVRLVSVLLSDQFELRHSAQSALLSLFPDGKAGIEATDVLPSGEVIARFCDRITGRIVRDVAIEIADLATVTRAHVIILDALAAVHGLSIFTGGRLLPHFLAQGDVADRLLATALARMLDRVAATEIVGFTAALLPQKVSQFAGALIARPLTSVELRPRLIEHLAQAMTGFVLTD